MNIPVAIAVNGRLGFRYSVINTNLNGDYIGIDTVSYDASAIPEPTTVLAGLGCMMPILSSLLGRRRKSA